ncbi:hypothetical protein [Nocardia farcinica]
MIGRDALLAGGRDSVARAHAALLPAAAESAGGGRAVRRGTGRRVPRELAATLG